MDMDLILLIDDSSEYPAHFSITPSWSQSTRSPVDWPWSLALSVSHSPSKITAAILKNWWVLSAPINEETPRKGCNAPTPSFGTSRKLWFSRLASVWRPLYLIWILGGYARTFFNELILGLDPPHHHLLSHHPSSKSNEKTRHCWKEVKGECPSGDTLWVLSYSISKSCSSMSRIPSSHLSRSRSRLITSKKKHFPSASIILDAPLPCPRHITYPSSTQLS